jgi:RHS repeat-associated protein
MAVIRDEVASCVQEDRRSVDVRIAGGGVVGAGMGCGSAGWGFPNGQRTATAAGALSDPKVGNQIGFEGFDFGIESKLYRVRHRSYVPERAQWLERDPEYYIDGMNLYQEAQSAPVFVLATVEDELDLLEGIL